MTQDAKLNVEQVKEPMLALLGIPGMPDRLELKPERVQQALARMLGWEERPGVPGLHRVRGFASGMEAEAYAGLVMKLAVRRRQKVSLELTGKQVHVAIQGRPGKAGFSNAVYALACALG